MAKGQTSCRYALADELIPGLRARLASVQQYLNAGFN